MLGASGGGLIYAGKLDAAVRILFTIGMTSGHQHVLEGQASYVLTAIIRYGFNVLPGGQSAWNGTTRPLSPTSTSFSTSWIILRNGMKEFLSLPLSYGL